MKHMSDKVQNSKTKPNKVCYGKLYNKKIMSNNQEGTNNCGLYIHIPFCKKKCHYCDFLSFDHCIDSVETYIKALVEEIKAYGKLFEKDCTSIKTIFIGGGTPSVIDEKFIQIILETIYSTCHVIEGAEITIECNPGTLNVSKVKCYKKCGINRISLGLQSTNNRRLQALGRVHNLKTFVETYALLREYGFSNINIDLMFGLPDQSIEEWKETLEQVIELQPEHISVYGLTIEENTEFYRKYQDNSLNVPNEEEERAMYWLANKILAGAGYRHDEISNYSQEGYQCQHNDIYWLMENYVGVGLGASSYYKGIRYNNEKQLRKYMDAYGNLLQLKKNQQHLSVNQKKEEYMFLGLRRMDGINISDYKKNFGEKIECLYEEPLKKMEEEKLIINDGCSVKLTAKGIDVSNYVFCHFLISD